MQAISAKSKVSLAPWKDEDFPVCWLWMEPHWRQLADDSMPRDLDTFVEIRRRQDVINLGVYRDNELGGLLTLVPRSPWLGDGHCIFRRAFMDRETPVQALELAKRFAWKIGYRKINCMVFPDNKAMIYLLLRAGALREGRHFAHTQREGRPTDMLSFAILEDSWR